MALDGLEIRALVRGLQPVLPAKINRIHQVSDTEVLFQLHHNGAKYQLLISAHSSYNRLNLTKLSYPTPEVPSNFIMVLRKYLESGIITAVAQDGLDRYVRFTISTISEMGDPIRYQLYAELMGKYANLILVAPDNRIINALKLIPPYENTQRIIQIGAQFELTPPLPGKSDPLEAVAYDESRSLLEQFDGFSPLLEKEVRWQLAQGRRFCDIMAMIASSDRIYVYDQPGKSLFHLIPLEHTGLSPKSYPLFEGIDAVYYSLEEHDRIRQQTGDLFKLVRKEIKKLSGKIAKLEEALSEAKASGPWKEKGQLIYANLSRIPKGASTIDLISYETGEPVTIRLDPRLDAKGNAKKCFQKYTKGRNGQVYIQEQLDLAGNELAYFRNLEYQLANADFKDAAEIQQELIALGHLKSLKARARRHKEVIPAFRSFKTPSGAIIAYGKNNLQNEYLTWKKAAKRDLWFHVKDQPGSHVLLIKDDPQEEDIRLAAMCAAFHSGARDSSSIPVNWCPVRNLKKIPGGKAGLVSLGSYKTIYIDIIPDKLKADPEGPAVI